MRNRSRQDAWTPLLRLLVLGAVTCGSTVPGAAYLQLTGGWQDKGAERQLEQKLALSNGYADFALQYLGG